VRLVEIFYRQLHRGCCVISPSELFVTNINAFLDEALGPVRRE